ncbi:MAG: hypothetical protein CM1200mP13_07790 [Candidatus Pelagibacterales bacterium]|nr:MAG: hypothetical protein CM1200mP13_07790 [Pelagibacterales bacterium]
MKKNNIIYLNGLVDLAQSRLGSQIVYKTDEFFAPAKRIINPWPLCLKRGCLINMVSGWMDGKQEEKEQKDMII